MRKLLAVAVLTTCVISAAAALAAGPTPVPVLANPDKSEAGGVSANGYLIWYQSPNRGGGPQSYVFLGRTTMPRCGSAHSRRFPMPAAPTE